MTLETHTAAVAAVRRAVGGGSPAKFERCSWLLRTT